jgi:hypothetical protein
LEAEIVTVVIEAAVEAMAEAEEVNPKIFFIIKY